MYSVYEINAQNLEYSPKWYGANACPTPFISSMNIPNTTNITTNIVLNSGRYDDFSTSLFFDFEMPILKEVASFRIYGYPAEYYQWTDQCLKDRNIDEKYQKGIIVGDLYIQTRLNILKERSYIPALNLNVTLKTASPATNKHKRYFDTPGYFFLLEYSKDLYKNEKTIIKRVSLYGYLGFMCWETKGSLQNDAPTYSLSANFTSKYLDVSTGLSAYNGWMTSKYGKEFGDNFLVYRIGLNWNINKNIAINLNFEKGIKDYLYNNLGIGLTYKIYTDANSFLPF